MDTPIPRVFLCGYCGIRLDPEHTVVKLRQAGGRVELRHWECHEYALAAIRSRNVESQTAEEKQP